MNRVFEVALPWEISKHSDELSITMEVSSKTRVAISVALSMLQENLITNATFVSADAFGKTVISVIENQSEKLSLVKVSEKTCHISMTKDSLGYLLIYVLQFVRDKYASVDHIHIAASTTEGGQTDLIFRATPAMNPMTPEQAEEWLLG